MASLKVAVRVRPFNQRERDMGAKLIIQMDGKKTRIVNSKAKKETDTSRDRSKEFTFDYSYWSFDSMDSQYTSQDEVYNDLGVEVIDSAFEGYNACVFAYGQTGSGKTYTMMGSADSLGLIPRICKTLFARMKEGSAAGTSYRTEVSYLEIYNERVKDLLRANTSHSLKIREHPKKGPYVENLSRHLVSEYTDIEECMIRGSAQRTTASTNMNDVSSRSHAIFTIMFVQAGFSNDMPSETVSKVHLVDLAGSERADATGATGQRLKEGAHINKSLVTLGSVISALAELSSHQANEIVKTRSIFIPYRDSVLTWLLKDSLGGNSKTIMIAAISPADCNYGETLSTLRYANRAKNIINKPTINEDANVKLIRELRDEISKLKALILSNNDLDSSLSSVEASVLAQLHKKQAQEKVLTEEWATKWKETQLILQEQRALGLRKADGGGGGVVLDSDAPHLVGIDDDVLSTGVALYQLRDGQTRVGRGTDQDIVLTGAGVEHEHCVVTLDKGVAMLEPVDSAQCWVNTVLIDKPTRLTQGCIILLGRTNMFRYNDPVEAAKLRKSGSRSQLNLSRLSLLSWSTTDLATSTENLLTDEHHHHHHHNNQDNLDAQRATLQREKDAFAQQQREREIDWAAEQKARRDALDVAQRLLEDEKQRMEADYRAQCRRLADDWRKLEERQQENAAALQRRELELQQKKELLEWERNEMMAQVEAECRQIAAIEAAIVTKQHVFSELLSRTLSSLTIECSASKIERLLSQSQGTPLSEEDSEFLYNLLQGADQESVEAIKDLISQHKKELASLESDLQVRIELLSTHRDNVDRIESELSELSEEQLTPPKIGPGGDSSIIESQKQDIVKRTNQQMQELLDKKKSLTLNLKRVISPLNESTENSISNSSDSNVFSSTTYEDTASKHTSEYSTPLKTSETFHTAMSSCGCNEAVDNQECCTHLSTHVVVLNDSGVDIENVNNNKKSQNNNTYNAQYLSDTYNIPTCSDSDDNPSSVEDCKVISTEEGGNSAQSSSSFEKVSPLECFRQRKNQQSCLRQVGREGGIRAMKRLCQRMARQKLVIVRNIETECSREELNEQISVLQELQRQYVKLEIALQGHTNASSDDKNVLSPTLEHPLNNVLDNSTVDEMNKFVSPKNENCISSPDSEPKKFINGTENYNISPDIILHVKNDPCCSKDQSNLVNSVTSYSKIINNDDMIPNMSKDLEMKRKSFNLIEYRRNSSLSSDKEGQSEEEPAVLECGAASVVSVSSGDSDTRVKSVYLANQNINSGSLLSLTRSLPTFAAYENSGHAISVPTYVLRGSGSKTHFEYEVRINVQGERWSLLRRYRRFRELHLNMKSKYGAKIDAIPFPPRQLFSSTSEPVARQRRGLLEAYLRRLLTVCMTLPNCPLYCPSQLKDGPTRPVCEIINKLQLLEFSAFFKRGTFESSKYGTS